MLLEKGGVTAEWIYVFYVQKYAEQSSIGANSPSPIFPPTIITALISALAYPISLHRTHLHVQCMSTHHRTQTRVPTPFSAHQLGKARPGRQILPFPFPFFFQPVCCTHVPKRLPLPLAPFRMPHQTRFTSDTRTGPEGAGPIRQVESEADDRSI